MKKEQLHHSLSGREDRPTVVLLHGFMGSSADWTDVIKDLYTDFRCLAVDLPGHGKSVCYEDGLYTIEGAAEALNALLDELGVDRCRLIGYSMGGRVALYFALHYSERCRQLVLESASPGLEHPDERAERRRVDDERATRIAGGNFERFLEEWYRQPLFESLSRHGLVERMVRSRLENDRVELARALRGMSPGRQPPLWNQLPKLHPETLALAGELDGKYRGLMQEVAQRSPAADAVILPEAGHNVHAERPDAFLKTARAFFSGAP